MSFLAFVPLSQGMAQSVHSAQQESAIVEMLACEILESRRQRMRCLDSSIEILSQAFPELRERALQLAAETSEAHQVQSEADFGASDLPASLQDADNDADELRELNSQVISTSRTLSGDLVFVLANGQVWQQLGSDRANPSIPRSGEPYAVTLRRGFLGSHFLKIGNERPAVRVERIR